MSAHTPTLMVMAGGTGGHIFPGIAVAQALRARGWDIVWLGNPQGMEAKLVPAQGFRMFPVDFSGLRGKGVQAKLLLPLRLLRAARQAARALREAAPDVVVGMGGYVTVPGGLMAAIQGRPLVVHEQNSIAGLANRVLARLARRVLCGFPRVLAGGHWVGNPVRREIAGLTSPAARYDARQGPLRILVVGGSLGAAPLNAVLPQALQLIPEARRPLVTHQAGAQQYETLCANYAAAGVQARVLPFIDDMAAAYSDADVVICRAGALTVAELAAAGVASLLVPLPHAVDDHQTANARFLSEQQAGFLLPQRELDASSLAGILTGLERPRLREMAIAARALAKPEAAETVADICEQLLRERQ